MKITSLFIENILKLKAVTIIPESDIIEIKGRNGAGKSSLLKAIVMGFKGKKEFDEVPIRRGQKKGKIEIKVDGDPMSNIPSFIITETITDKTVNLTIKPESVLAGETPRSFLDKLIGKISFDPFAWINEDGKKQKQVLRELMGIEVEDNKLESEEKRLYDERTMVGRELKTAETNLLNQQKWDNVKDEQEISIAELLNKLTSAIEFNSKIEAREHKNNELRASAIKNKNRISDINQQIISLQKELADLEKILEGQRAIYAEEKGALSLVEKINIDDIKEEMSKIDAKNSRIRDNQSYKHTSDIFATIKEQYDKIDGAIEECRNRRVELMAKAQIPVAGLTFDDDGLLYNDIPLKQCSTGESIMVWLPIAMKLNPSLRVLLIKDASLLDDDNMKLIQKIVDKKKSAGNEYQIFMEKMSNSPDGFGIFIKDGDVVGDGSCPNSGNGITVNSDDF